MVALLGAHFSFVATSLGSPIPPRKPTSLEGSQLRKWGRRYFAINKLRPKGCLSRSKSSPARVYGKLEWRVELWWHQRWYLESGGTLELGTVSATPNAWVTALRTKCANADRGKKVRARVDNGTVVCSRIDVVPVFAGVETMLLLLLLLGPN